jgi:hypothetical protein
MRTLAAACHWGCATGKRSLPVPMREWIASDFAGLNGRNLPRIRSPAALALADFACQWHTSAGTEPSASVLSVVFSLRVSATPRELIS